MTRSTDRTTDTPATTAHASRRSWRAAAIGVLVLAGAGIGASVAWKTHASQQTTPVTAGQIAAPPALELLLQDTVLVATGEIRQSINLTGTLQPLNQIDVKSPLPGQVVQVNAREGDQVHKGQILATLDASDLQARLRDRQAALEGGQAQLALATKTRANNEALLAQNFISQAAFDNSLSGYRTAQSTVTSLQAQVEQARKALADTVVRSPIDGVVSARVAQPGLSVPVNGMLMTVQDLSQMELEVQVPTSQIPAVHIGQRAAFGIEGFAAQKFEGKVERISPSAVSGSRAIAVFLRVANPQRQLRGGMFAQGAIVTDSSSQVVVLPETALRERDGASHVLRIEDNVLRERAVQLGARDSANGLVEIRAGLVSGDRVVVSRAANVKDGQAVQVQAPLARASGGARADNG